MAEDRESSKEYNFATEDNAFNEFDFAMKNILSEGGKFSMGRRFAMEGNFTTQGVLSGTEA